MSVTAAQGFLASGVHAGIRRSGPDLAIVRSAVPAVGAAVWTTNRVLAAPVVVSKRHLEVAEPQAVVINAGVANAATGSTGIADAEQTAAQYRVGAGSRRRRRSSCSRPASSAFRCRWIGCSPGCRRPRRRSIPTAGTQRPRRSSPPTAGRSRPWSTGDGFVVGGMAKGAGMIHPRLATMLAIVTTDYPLEPGEPASLLRTAVDASFNRISVDGECSTNDAVVLLANGASGVERTAARDEQFAAALGEVCAALAREIVADGEGSTVLLEIAVSGAVSDAEAEAVARRIATSPLVKTAAFGRDPNWGRVLAAAGSAPWNGGFAHVDADRLSVSFDGTPVFVRGEPTGAQPDLGGTAVAIDLDLGLGTGSASYLASDLTYDYVRLNAEYTT